MHFTFLACKNTAAVDSKGLSDISWQQTEHLLPVAVIVTVIVP